MSLVKGFLRSKPTQKLPKYKYSVGIVVGLLMAFFLYALQYTTREFFRLSSVSDDSLWVLNDAEVNFYNLIFAFIAVIVGQSFCFEYLFNRPKHIFNIRPGRLRTIVNDQRFLNWYFLAWFSKVATMYGFLFGTAGLSDFYIMSFYPDFNYLFVLIVIVLFLQTWNGLLLTFKRRAFKWMLASMALVSILSLGLSKIDIVNYKKLNEMMLNKRLDVQYNLRLPKSSIYSDKSPRFKHLPTLSLVTLKDSGEKGVLLFVGQTKISIGKLPLEIIQMKAEQTIELQHWMPAYLRIDKEVPMSFVLEIKRELGFVNLHQLKYMVVPSNPKYDERYYSGHKGMFLAQYNMDYFAPQHSGYLKRANAVSNRIDISISNTGYEIDAAVLPLNKLTDVIRILISQDSDYSIVLNFRENISFGRYFGVISSINEAIFSLRNRAALNIFAMDYETLEEQYHMKDELRFIIDKYPMWYTENWDESGILLPEKTQPDFALPAL